jgi:oxygen-independent coproporphyrinogen-3 oxidase
VAGDGSVSSAFGVYVHIPFCASRCDYCDFATWTDRAHLVDAYVDACVADVHRRVAGGAMAAATSVFFGGGTPSLLTADQLVRILEAVPRVERAEVTVECNPDSVDEAKLAAYRAAGVDRLSFGVQSMAPHVLASLGRTHDPANVRRAVAAARAAGFERLNLDLIYGAPGETPDDWRATLDEALALEPSHVSAYALTVEPATPLGRAVAAGTRLAPDDDDQADKYAIADERLQAAGLGWYEISNWSRPGDPCRHNLLYWRQDDYAGIGCAAHGHTDGRRWWNVRTPERYVERVAAGRSTEAGAEVLDPDRRAEEAFLLALRTRDGATCDAGADRAVDELAGLGLVERRGGRVVLTRAGRLVANEVTVRLLAAGARRHEGAGTR